MCIYLYSIHTSLHSVILHGQTPFSLRFYKGREAAIERHGVAESKSRLERGSNGEVKNGNDWEVDGKWLNVCG